MRRGIVGLALALVLLLPLVAPVTASNGERPVVVCTTTVLASIVRDLAGDAVVVEVVASPTICPAHYDVKPSDVEAFRRADLILMHGFEPWVNDLKEASGTQAPIVRISGPWSTPEMLKARYQDVASALSEHLGLDVSGRLGKCLNGIDEVASWLKSYASENGFEGKPVVCMLWQKAFVDFLGFRIVAVFKPPEMVSAKEYEEIITNATSQGAVLVIDNLQSGTELGERIADEVGAVEVALTNFPGTAPGLNNVTQVMKYNAEQLARALREVDVAREVSSLKSELETWRAATILASTVAAIFIVATIALAVKLKGGR